MSNKITLFGWTFVNLLLITLECAQALTPPRPCPSNEEFRESGPVCENCGPRCLAISLEAKCYCKPGFSRLPRPNNICIPDAFCKYFQNYQQCPPNEVFQNGGPACEGCGIRCLAIINTPKCYCKPGFSRLPPPNSICIPNAYCPYFQNYQQCPSNEVFQNSGPLCEGCGIRCQAIINTPKCYCRQGFSRLPSPSNICIPNAYCPYFQNYHQCPPNEVFQNGGPACENCGPRCQVFTQTPKCYCRPGYSRLNNVCIPNANCPGSPPTTCPANERFQNSGKLCEGCPPTCQAIINKPKCYCVNGFVRFPNRGCLPEQFCRTRQP